MMHRSQATPVEFRVEGQQREDPSRTDDYISCNSFYYSHASSQILKVMCCRWASNIWHNLHGRNPLMTLSHDALAKQRTESSKMHSYPKEEQESSPHFNDSCGCCYRNGLCTKQ